MIDDWITDLGVVDPIVWSFEIVVVLVKISICASLVSSKDLWVQLDDSTTIKDSEEHEYPKGEID